MIAPRDGEMGKSVPPPVSGSVADADKEQKAAERSFACLLCGHVMYGVHCKLNCPNCGYKEDCSDLFPS